MTMTQALYNEIKGLLDMPSPPGRDGRIFAYCPLHNDGAKSGKNPSCRPGAADHGRSLSLHPQYGLTTHCGCVGRADKEGFERMLAALRARAPQREQRREPQRQQARTRQGETASWKDPATGEEVYGIPSFARLAGLYEYRYPDGELAAVKGRWEWQNVETGEPSKSFKWRRPNSSWSLGLSCTACKQAKAHVAECACLKMEDMPLWGAELVSASDPAAAWWFVEGEKACQALRARNEHAVCLGGGAWQTAFGAAFEVLRGHPVRLWPDNDEPGRKYMGEVRKALGGIARSITLINAPVKPKGDAHDFFAGGGNLGALLDGVLERPAVSVISDDHYLVRVPCEGGVCEFTFREMLHSRQGARGAIDCELSIRVLGPGIDDTPYTLRINLLSQSARSSLETALGRQFGKLAWTTVCSQAWAAVMQAFDEVDRALDFEDLPEQSGADRFLIDQLLPEGVPTVLFGDGSAGKSMLAMGMASALAAGAVSFAGRTVRRQANVMYIDWETDSDPSAPKRRRRRVLDGMGFPREIHDAIPMKYVPAHGAPLEDLVTSLRKSIERNGIEVVIIDSGAIACGGKPEDSDVATAFFRAVGRLRVTTLIICHISKGAQAEKRTPDKPFGSAFWHNLSRRTWYVSRSSEAGSDVIELGLYCKKNNDGRPPHPIGVRVEFEGDDGPVTFTKMDAGEITGAWENLDDWERAREVIKDQAQGVATLEVIAKGIGMDNPGAYQVLRARMHNRRTNKGLFLKMGGRDGDPKQEWALWAGWAEAAG